MLPARSSASNPATSRIICAVHHHPTGLHVATFARHHPAGTILPSQQSTAKPVPSSGKLSPATSGGDVAEPVPVKEPPRFSPRSPTRTDDQPDDLPDELRAELLAELPAELSDELSDELHDELPDGASDDRRATVYNNLDVVIDGYDVTALVDTGADYSVMSGELCRRLRKVTTQWDGPDIRTAGGHLVRPIGRCTARIEINGLRCPVTFVVLSKCSRDIILGMDFLSDCSAVIDFTDRRLTLRQPRYTSAQTKPQVCTARVLAEHVTVPPQSSVFLPVTSDHVASGEVLLEGSAQLLLERGLGVARGIAQLDTGCVHVLVTNFCGTPQRLTKGTALGTMESITAPIQVVALSEGAFSSSSQQNDAPLGVSIAPNLSVSERAKLIALLAEFQDCFSTSSGVRQTTIAKHRIITDDAAHPVRQSPYRVSFKEREVIQNQVQEMLADDIIQPSHSPWAAPVVLVKKKDGTLRFCVDYRRLNNVTKKDVYPLPRIDDALDHLRHARYFSSIDLKSGYWQIEVDERDREKTAFITPDGLYEFKVMPFGLCTAPATFQRVMDTVLAGLKWQTCLVYLDDVVIFSSTFSDHLLRLRAVLQAIRSAGLTLKPTKCKFAYDELKFLGHVVSSAGVRPDPDKTAAVASFPTPSDKNAVRRFLGLCAYYRRFVPNFSHVAAPLTHLTKENVAFQWSDEQQRAFDRLKQSLQTSPVLGHFDQDAETEVHTDASNKGLGAVLIQKQNGTERVIAYASRTLSKAETNYSTTEKECLAVVWAINKFRPYLYGRPFQVVTDHHSLCWLSTLRDPSGRLARWALRLQEFDATIVYKSGRRHTDADCLSRAPIESASDGQDDEYEDAFIGTISTVDMAARQRHDTELREVIAHLEGQEGTIPRVFLRVLPALRLRNNVLYKKSFAASARSWLLVIPADLRNEIMDACHDDPTSGHLGYSRTLARIRSKYYWPQLAKTVRHYTRTCRECQRRKTPPVQPAGHLHPIPPPMTPFQQVGMDLLGPFPTSNSGHRWIAVATDYLTRYAESRALPSATAADVAKFFVESIVLRHGAPEVLITDRGAAFVSQLMAEILRLSNTHHRKTTAYHPQTNGLTERLNKTMADMISMYVDVEHRTWDDILPYVTFAYNTATQETTGFSPFRLVHGREVITMLDAMLPHEPEAYSYDDVQLVTQHAEEARQLARLRIQDRQHVDARRYNLRHREVHFAPGDKVWVWTPVRRRGLSEKLLKRYFGPYEVVRRISDVNYEVIPIVPSTSRRPPHPEVVHVVRLKTYCER